MKIFKGLWGLLRHRHPFPAPVNDLSDIPFYKETEIDSRRLYLPDQTWAYIRMKSENEVPEWIYKIPPSKSYINNDGSDKMGYLFCNPLLYLIPQGVQYTETNLSVPNKEAPPIDNMGGVNELKTMNYIFGITIGYETENSDYHYNNRSLHGQGREGLERDLIDFIRQPVVGLLKFIYNEDSLKLNNLKVVELMDVVALDNTHPIVPYGMQRAESDPVETFRQAVKGTHYGVKIRSILCEFQSKQLSKPKDLGLTAPIVFRDQWQDRKRGRLHLLKCLWQLLKWRRPKLLLPPIENMEDENKWPKFHSLPITCKCIDKDNLVGNYIVVDYAPRSTWGLKRIPKPWLFELGKNVKKIDYLKYQPYVYIIPKNSYRRSYQVSVSRIENAGMVYYDYEILIVYRVIDALKFYENRMSNWSNLSSYIWSHLQKPISGLLCVNHDHLMNKTTIDLLTLSMHIVQIPDVAQSVFGETSLLDSNYEIRLLKNAISAMDFLKISSIKVTFKSSHNGR